MAFAVSYGSLVLGGLTGGSAQVGDTITLDATIHLIDKSDVPEANPTPGSYTVTIGWSVGGQSGTITTAQALTPAPVSGSYFYGGVGLGVYRVWTYYGSHKLAAPISWTIPPAVGAAIATKRSDTVTFTATFIGDRGNKTTNTTASIRIPDTAIPTISDIAFTEHGPGIPAGWPFIVGKSIVKASVVAAGALGSTITTRVARHLEQAADIPAAGLPLTRAGTCTVRAAVTDSRGRTATLNKALPVVDWAAPQPGEWVAQRCNAAGTPDPAGTNLRVVPAASWSSVGGLNTRQLKVWTRPPGGSWTLRNTIDPPGTTYTAPILVGGGAIYDTATAWEVRLDVIDTLQTVQDARVVPSGAKVLDAWPTGEVALGKLIDPDGPKTQLDGPARIYGDLTVDGSLSSQGGRLLPYSCAAGTIAQPTTSGTTVTFPAGVFTQPPIVTTGQARSANYAKAIVTNKTATSCKISASGSGETGTVDWFAIQMLPGSAAG